jgi:hypothetical protein
MQHQKMPLSALNRAYSHAHIHTCDRLYFGIEDIAPPYNPSLIRIKQQTPTEHEAVTLPPVAEPGTELLNLKGIAPMANVRETTWSSGSSSIGRFNLYITAIAYVRTDSGDLDDTRDIGFRGDLTEIGSWTSSFLQSGREID